MLEHIGPAARDARERAGLKQIDIATAARVSHVAVSRFERAESWPRHPDALVEAYAAELGVEPIELWQAALERWRSSPS